MSVLNQLNNAIARNKSKARAASPKAPKRASAKAIWKKQQRSARRAPRPRSASSSATRKQVTSLRRSGYEVSEVELPDGTKIVLKSSGWKKAAKKATTRKKAPARKKAAKKAPARKKAAKKATKRSPAQIAATKRMLAANKRARAAAKK